MDNAAVSNAVEQETKALVRQAFHDIHKEEQILKQKPKQHSKCSDTIMDFGCEEKETISWSAGICRAVVITTNHVEEKFSTLVDNMGLDLTYMIANKQLINLGGEWPVAQG